MNFFSGKYRKLELFACAKCSEAGKEGSLRLLKNQCEIARFQLFSGCFQRLEIPLEEGEYCFEMQDAMVSQMYLKDSEDMLETGTKYLMVNNKNVEMFHIKEFMDTPVREQYHFMPFVNWNNDPNGLCWHKGYYHLFYQSNPHEQKWGKMYWGHAVSRDLVHWKHLPFALEPQKEVLDSSTMTGGAFSGSAISTDEGIRLFFTRDAEVVGDVGSIRQSQFTARSEDGVHFGEEKELLPAFSLEGIDVNFRDPKVFCLDSKWYMVISSNYYGKASVLLYTSEDLLHWEFLRPLLQVEDDVVSSTECPDFFRLKDRYVLLASLMDVRTEHGVYQPVKYYIGQWKDEKFQWDCEGVCDFGGNFYGTQTFEHEGRRILFGWICDWYKEHETEENGAYGSVTLPRVLSLKGDCLYQKPAIEVYSLLGDELFKQEKCAAAEVEIPGNSYYGQLLFLENTGFEILLASDGEDFLKLVGSDGEVELISTKNKDKLARFIAKTREVKKIEIFMDRRVVEIYVNDGEKVGTKLFISHSKEGIFKAFFEEPMKVEQVLVRKMEAIW